MSDDEELFKKQPEKRRRWQTYWFCYWSTERADDGFFCTELGLSFTHAQCHEHGLRTRWDVSFTLFFFIVGFGREFA